MSTKKARIKRKNSLGEYDTILPETTIAQIGDVDNIFYAGEYSLALHLSHIVEYSNWANRTIKTYAEFLVENGYNY